ncbi:hypothetical protein YC2023_014479 [Brassica napus]
MAMETQTHLIEAMLTEVLARLPFRSIARFKTIIEPWRLGDGYKEFFLDAPDSVKGPNNQGHWLVKSIQCVLDILKNADSNAEGCGCLSHCFPPYPFHGSQYIVWWGLQDLGLQQKSLSLSRCHSKEISCQSRNAPESKREWSQNVLESIVKEPVKVAEVGALRQRRLRGKS